MRHNSAVVTGPTSGIGFGIARALARSGTNVMLNGLGAPSDERVFVLLLAVANTRTPYAAKDWRLFPPETV